MNNVFYVSAYRNGVSDDEAIKRCFADAAALDERTVIFDGGDYLINDSVLLKSNTTVIIDGCKIKQADEAFDTVFRGDNLVINEKAPFASPTHVSPIKNIKILGKNGAKIEGPDKNRVGYHPFFDHYEEMTGDFWGWRTLMISLSLCDGFEVGGIEFTKTRCWAISFDLCTGGYVHDLTIKSNVKNGDGIDFRSGCHNCVVENIVGDTSDDTIALTALFKKRPATTEPSKYLYSCEPTRCIQQRDEYERDISDITVKNVKTGGMHHGLICLAANGCHVRNITIENVEETDTDLPKEIREATIKIYTGYGTGYIKGDISDITVKNVSALYARSTIHSNADVERVTLENITHSDKEKPALLLEYPDGYTII